MSDVDFEMAGFPAISIGVASTVQGARNPQALDVWAFRKVVRQPNRLRFSLDILI
ncbi:hypothetical protein [Mesorhizobium norvegicum]|uniref:hypothetical protein n=1 Tax=Mesorhizobium norvegicum TaxID=1085774 RepID=UPI001459FD46|nr:hypothetical protein [Mesorhizobium norvegicum]